MTQFKNTNIFDRLMEVAERAYGQGSPEHLDVCVNALVAAHEVYQVKQAEAKQQETKKGKN